MQVSTGTFAYGFSGLPGLFLTPENVAIHFVSLNAE